MNTRKTLGFVILMLLASGTISVACAQDIGLPQFFQINIKEVDEPANTAMTRLTDGMSLTLTALNRGKNQKVTVDPEYGKQALQDFTIARETLVSVLNKIPLRKVNLDVIHKSSYAKAYDELVVSLRDSGYPEPSDSKTFFGILTTIIDASRSDLNKLMNPSPGAAGQQAMVGPFLDLIKQKTLLERIGSTSGIITIAMQG